jgi:hypothetical protein
MGKPGECSKEAQSVCKELFGPGWRAVLERSCNVYIKGKLLIRKEELCL